MKTYKNLLMMAVMAIVATACTQDAELPTPAGNDRPLVVTATLPVQAWGVESRAEGDVADLTLHYYKVGENAPTAFVINNPTYGENGSISFTTKAGNEEGAKPLVWSQIKKDDEGKSTFYLTAVKGGVAYWATATVSHNDKITFENEMKPRKARFTVVLTVSGNIQLYENSFSFTLGSVKDAAETATNVTVQDWPTVDTNPTDNTPLASVIFDSQNKTYTVTNDFAPQTVGGLSIAFEDKFEWTVKLSELALTDRTENANVFNAGEHITINVTVTLDELGTPNITVSPFTSSDEVSLNGEVE